MSDFSLMGMIDTDRPIAFGVLVVFYGDGNYAFLETEKETMKLVIADAVKREMLPGTEAEVFTMSIK
ncbi:hypothetical protein KA005_04920 [bacterium]|nr:hypothetical protein [bacterium]